MARVAEHDELLGRLRALEQEQAELALLAQVSPQHRPYFPVLAHTVLAHTGHKSH